MWRLLSYIFAISVSHASAGLMQESLNAMELMMSGNPDYDPDFYNNLVQCLQTADPNLVELHDIIWEGVLELGGNSNINTYKKLPEEWRNCSDLPADYEPNWFEFNCTVQTQPSGELYIFEPCNYASNMVFYHMAYEICSELQSILEQSYYGALVKASSYLAVGSALLHGSQTSLGGTFDVRLNDLIIYLMYQDAMKSFESLGSPVITDLSDTFRPHSAIEVTNLYEDIFRTLPVDQWEQAISDASDIPSLSASMCGLIGTAASLVFEEDIVDAIAEWIVENVDVFNPEEKEFCLVTYLSEIKNVTRDIVLTPEEVQLVLNTTSSILIKFGYAAVWQEHVLIREDWVFTPEANEIGALLLPIVNDFANTFLAVTHPNQDFQHGINLYPGEFWCDPLIPHAKWHVEAAVALLDIIYAGKWLDEIFTSHIL